MLFEISTLCKDLVTSILYDIIRLIEVQIQLILFEAGTLSEN